MAESYDVIVVGARCAGSPLATLLAREGARVAVVERATFPKDTLSTHIFQGPAINFLRRLGVLDQLYAAGARVSTHLNGRQEQLSYEIDVALRPGDEGAFMSVRRFVLDPLLAEAAQNAGAEMMMATNVTGLEQTGDRVSGVRVSSGGAERVLRARLVVGADGRNSTVAELTGARKYNVTPGQRFGYWGFFSGPKAEKATQLVYHRWERRFVIATPADSGLYQVIVFPDLVFLPEFKRDREAAFMAHANASAPVAEMLDGCERVGKLLGMIRYECFFREAAGPGWALVGDSGHFKDPAPGQGISDAFRQAQALAPVITRSLGGSDDELDNALADWARWRDRDAAEHYWLAYDFGEAGLAPAVTVEILRQLQNKGRMDEVGDVLQHRKMPSKVFTPGRLLGAGASLMTRPGADRRAVLREIRELVAEGARRQRVTRRPEFVPLDTHRDAGDTEVPEAVAA